LALCAVVLVGCDFPGKPDPANRPRTPSEIMGFEVLFKANCAGCHGAEGKLGPAPPLNDPLFLHIASTEQLSQVIHNGRRGTPMPAFARANGGTLTDQQIKVLADGLPEHWKTDQKFPKDLPQYEVASAEGDKPAPGDVKRGQEVFARACALCHGDNGEGGGAGAINDPEFLAIISNRALRRIVITGRPDLGMPSYAKDDGRPPDFKPLTSDEIDDLVALLASWRINADVASTTKPGGTP
jgi:mono/diheme cytochrome c family protein